MNDLEKYEYEEGIQESQNNQEFVIKDESTASWCLKKIKVIKHHMEINKALIDLEKSRLDDWLDKEIQNDESSIAFFESRLEYFFLMKRGKDPKYKLKTPHGYVSTKKQNPSWEYDEETAIDSLKKAGLYSLIKTNDSLIKAAVKAAEKEGHFQITTNGKLVTLDGEIIEGITVTDQPDKVVIKC